MNAITVLCDEYPGDEAWKRFVAAFESEWKKRQDQHLYLAVIPDEEFAIVLSWSMGRDSVNWFMQPCEALSKRTPKDIFENESSGRRILRTLLMRMAV